MKGIWCSTGMVVASLSYPKCIKVSSGKPKVDIKWKVRSSANVAAAKAAAMWKRAIFECQLRGLGGTSAAFPAGREAPDLAVESFAERESWRLDVGTPYLFVDRINHGLGTAAW